MRTDQQPLLGKRGALVPCRWRCAGAGAVGMCSLLYGRVQRQAHVGESRDGLHVTRLQERQRKAPQS